MASSNGIGGTDAFSFLSSVARYILNPSFLTGLGIAIALISIIFFAMCGGDDDEDAPPPPPEGDPPEPPEGSPGGAGTASGYVFDYQFGDESLTCAFQELTECTVNQFCKGENWSRASDTPLCCFSVCIARIQAKNVPFAHLLDSTATIEKFGDSFGVWWGVSTIDPQVGFAVTEHEKYAAASLVGGNVYSFTAKNTSNMNHLFFFEVILESGTELTVNEVPR